jgi:hypothetical protein
VQRVRWYLGVNTDPTIDADPALNEGVGATTQKFNLYRQLQDTTGAPFPPAVLPGLPAEVVAEYAIDLKFGITVQDPATNALTVLDMDDTNPPAKGPSTLASPAAGSSVTGVTHDVSMVPRGSAGMFAAGPQNVKSVRFRIALRTPIADRDKPMPAPEPASSYRFRYCVTPICAGPTARFARIRTIVSEVALLNQQQPIFCNTATCP